MCGELERIATSLLMELLYAFVIYEYFKIFFEKKSIKGIYIYIFGINFIIQNIENNIQNYPDYCRIITTIIAVMIVSCFYNGLFVERVVFSLLFSAMGILGELLIACFFVACDISIKANSVVGYCTIQISLLIFIKIIQKIFKDTSIGYISWKTSLKIMLLPLGSMFLAYRIFYVQYEMGIRGFYWKTMISIIILISINIVMFNIFIQLTEIMELQRKTAIYEKEFNLLESHMHEREILNEEFRIKRHDMKHQMLKLLSLLHSGEYEKLENDIKNIAEFKTFNELFIANTENSVIDTFVNNKYALAIKNGIDFQVDLKIPREVPFAGEDLCVILGNALDNAIEACLRGNVDRKCIELQMVYDGENLIIIVRNTFDGILKTNRKGIGITRKEDKRQHGIGIYSIKNTIKKYHGTYHVSIKDKWYCLELILYSDNK